LRTVYGRLLGSGRVTENGQKYSDGRGKHVLHEGSVTRKG
jgi:hypothetical protein